MTFEAALEKADQADQLRQNCEFVAAGDAYLETAHEYFADNKGRHAIENIFYAIIGYRLSNDNREIIQRKILSPATICQWASSTAHPATALIA